MTQRLPELVLVRHGETEWSKSGRHTGRTDLPLTIEGRAMADKVTQALAGRAFVRVLTSPLARAKETCRRAGLGDFAEPSDDLLEWDYGAYEGLTTPQIREQNPAWSLWRDGCPGGESGADVSARVDRVIVEARAAGGDVVAFAHGHVLRVLAARWLGLGPEAGRYFTLSTATVSVLGYERDQPVIQRWNDAAHLGALESRPPAKGPCRLAPRSHDHRATPHPCQQQRVFRRPLFGRRRDGARRAHRRPDR